MNPNKETKLDDSEIVIDLAELAYRCWRSLPAILAAIVACAVLAYGVTVLFIKPTYSANADMLVNNQEKKDIGTVTTQDLTAASSLVDTYAIILTSHTVLEDVIETLDLPYDYEELYDMIEVTAVEETQVMRITVSAKSSKEAMRIVKQIVKIAPDTIMEAADVGSVKTVDAPWTTGEPVSPSKIKNTAIGALLGLVIALAVIVIRMLMSNTFKTESDVRDVLGLPVLAIVPVDGVDNKRRNS